MRIDTFAYSNRWRTLHPGEKGLFTLLCLTASLLGRTPHVPVAIAAASALLTIAGAGIPWRDYCRIAIIPVCFLAWSCITLAISFAGGGPGSVELHLLRLSLYFGQEGIDQGMLVFSRSLGATLSLLFLALTTPMTEIMGLLRSLGVPRLLVELMTISYRQIFVFLEISGQIRASQEARLGYSSPRLTLKSLGGLAGSILLRTFSRARQNHRGLLARGYDSELLTLPPERRWSPPVALTAGAAGVMFIILALTVRS